MQFRDRHHAGQQLAIALKKFRRQKPIILALPRGGVVVAKEIADTLNAPLDIVVPRKIGAPGNKELAIGAITESGEPILDQTMIKMYRIPQDYLLEQIELEQIEAARRLKLYRGGKIPLEIKNKTVILIDDGIATGLTIRAAIASVKQQNPQKIIIAVPVAASDTVSEIRPQVDELICLYIPDYFDAVGRFYQHFSQTEDEEVIEIMKKTPYT